MTGAHDSAKEEVTEALHRHATPYRDDRLYVCSRECATCVFKPGNAMELEPGRLKDLVSTNLENDSALVCHKTYYEDPDDRHAICRGFYDRFLDKSPPLLLAKNMGIITFIDPPS